MYAFHLACLEVWEFLPSSWFMTWNDDHSLIPKLNVPSKECLPLFGWESVRK